MQSRQTPSLEEAYRWSFYNKGLSHRSGLNTITPSIRELNGERANRVLYVKEKPTVHLWEAS